MSNPAAEVAEEALELGMLAPALAVVGGGRGGAGLARPSSAMLLLRIESPNCSMRRSSLACSPASPGPSLLLMLSPSQPSASPPLPRNRPGPEKTWCQKRTNRGRINMDVVLVLSHPGATRRSGEVYDGSFSKQGEVQGGVGLQLQECHQQVRGEAHACTGHHVEE